MGQTAVVASERHRVAHAHELVALRVRVVTLVDRALEVGEIGHADRYVGSEVECVAQPDHAVVVQHEIADQAIVRRIQPHDAGALLRDVGVAQHRIVEIEVVDHDVVHEEVLGIRQRERGARAGAQGQVADLDVARAGLVARGAEGQRADAAAYRCLGHRLRLGGGALKYDIVAVRPEHARGLAGGAVHGAATAAGEVADVGTGVHDARVAALSDDASAASGWLV